jgi:hypothetical protein
MRKYSEFPDGFAERMTHRDMSIVYETLYPEVHGLVDLLLARASDGLFRTANTLLDTPALALRALKLHVGGKLPRYDYDFGGGAVQEGETRTILPTDEFAIVGGPLSAHPQRGFVTILHRASTVDQLDNHLRTRLSCNDFADLHMQTVRS